MGKSLALLFLAITLYSFSQVKVLKTVSANVPVEGGFYTFENKEVKVIYNFWSDRGMFAFALQNKLTTPLYINWDKTHLILNGNFLDYRDDRPASDWYGDTMGRSTAFNFKWAERILNTTIQPLLPTEKITELKPNAILATAKFRLLQLDSYMGAADYVTDCEEEKNKMKMLKRSYNEDNTPFAFSNYLLYSGTNTFEQADTLQHHFWVNEIIRPNQFNVNASATATCPFAPHTSYYVYINSPRY